MIKVMNKVIALLLVVAALYTLYAVITPNHLYIG